MKTKEIYFTTPDIFICVVPRTHLLLTGYFETFVKNTGHSFIQVAVRNKPNVTFFKF